MDKSLSIMIKVRIYRNGQKFINNNKNRNLL